MKARSLTPLFTEYIPSELEPETLYISMEFSTAVHLCACGCRTKIVTPLGASDWILTYDGTVSLRPSVGNGQQPCRSHYYVKGNQIDWLPRISAAATAAAITRDRAAHNPALTRPTRARRWKRLWNRLKRNPKAWTTKRSTR